MGLWTEYKKKTAVKSTDTFLVYDNAEGVMQVDGSNVKKSFRDATDTTLSQADTPADAKAVGDRFAKVEKKNTEQDAAAKNKGWWYRHRIFLRLSQRVLGCKDKSRGGRCMADKIIYLAKWEDVEKLKAASKTQETNIADLTKELAKKANGQGITLSINESGGLRVTYDDGK